MRVGALVALASNACSPSIALTAPPADGRAPRPSSATGTGKIEHVVYILQENRSFNDLFNGYPGAYTVAKGKDSKGNEIALRPIGLRTEYIIDHSAEAMFAACDGTGRLPGTKCRMDGFDKEFSYGGPGRHPMYAYVPHAETKPYFDMAREWVLADRMFQSHLDDSFVSHQYAIAAQAKCRPAEGTVGMRAGSERHHRDDHQRSYDRQPRGSVLRL
jgi:phospholipase C